MSFASGCGDLVGVKCNPLLQSPLVSAVPPVPITVTWRAAVALCVVLPRDPSLGGELKQSRGSVSEQKGPPAPTAAL